MFIGLKSLEVLQLQRNRINFIDQSALNNMPSLVEVDLRSNLLLNLVDSVFVVNNGRINIYKIKLRQFNCSCSHQFVNDPDDVLHTTDWPALNQTGCTIYGREDIFRDNFHCRYDYDCHENCLCCDDSNECECRYPCPDQCICTKNYYSYNKLTAEALII